MRLELSQVIMRKKILLCVVLILPLCLTIRHINSSTNLLWSFENVSCYHSNDNDGLQTIKDNIAPPANSIFFHETSCTGRLNSRQACAVESSAKTHPGWQINVLFTGPVTTKVLDEGIFKNLTKYPNIKFFRVHLLEYAKGTPLESFINDGVLNKSHWQTSHTSDALRYLTLYKWGGVYLDLDMIVAKSFEDLAANWGARESEIAVAAGAISFSRDALGRKFADAAIRDFKNNFKGDIWGHNGPGVMTRILQNICKIDTLSEMSASVCEGFEVYGPELFYPVSWYNAKDYFYSKELHIGEPYTYHIWNKLTESYRVDKNSYYSKLAQKYCPVIYQIYEDNFGL